MQPSSQRLLTTHSGSLPRPTQSLSLLLALEDGHPVDSAQQVWEQMRTAVRQAAHSQAEAGVDVLNDGEMSRRGSAASVRQRLTGLCGEGGPVRYAGRGVLQADIEHLAIAAQGVSAEGVFMTASSPGAIALRAPSRYYASQEDYLAALAGALREEYEAIHAAGFLLQVDCPDLATRAPGAETTGEFRQRAALAVEALNHALSAIPAGSVRMHVCGGSPDLPGTTEAELGDIIDILLRARPAGLMLMAAGSRHAQDWKVFTETELPDGKYLVPGVLDSQTSLVEQPEAIADLLTCYALTVGPERMMAGAGCGFGSPAGNGAGSVQVTWAKFRSLAEGARLASERLWSKVPA